jgi:hypothetical protein
LFKSGSWEVVMGCLFGLLVVIVGVVAALTENPGTGIPLIALGLGVILGYFFGVSEMQDKMKTLQ